MQAQHHNFLPGAEDNLQGVGSPVLTALAAFKAAYEALPDGSPLKVRARDEIEAFLYPQGVGQGVAFSRYPGIPNSRRGKPNIIRFGLTDELMVACSDGARERGYPSIGHLALDLVCIEIHGKKFLELEADRSEISRVRRLEIDGSMSSKSWSAL